MSSLPSTKGWGSGWPNCQQDKITPNALFVGGIRDELVELVDLLTTECIRRGFGFLTPGCWGFGCRCVKTSSGPQDCTPGIHTPSFHSWGLAVDINAPRNVFGSDREDSEIATKFPWLPRLFAEYTFEWLGPVNGDWMHFQFVGSPADAKNATEAARRELGGEDDVKLEAYVAGFDEYIKRRREKGEDPGPPPDSMDNDDKRKGWTHARFAANNPKT